MIPDGWKKELFGNVASFKNGLNFTRSDTGDAIKIVGVGNFKAFSELSSTSHLDIIQVANKVKGIELLEDGDLLFVRSNGNKALIGRCLYFPNVTERLAFSGFTIRGRVNANEVLPKYASYLVRSSMVKAQFLKSGSGTNISNLSQQILNSVAFNLPPLPEQKKIAQILSTWDKAIETVEKLIANSQQKKKALMQQLLTGKKRFSEFDGEWKEVRLGDVLNGKKRKGKIVPTNENQSGMAYIGSTSFEGNFGIYTDSSDAVTCLPNDILVLWDGENAGKVTTGLKGAVSSTVVRYCINQEKANSPFLTYNLSRDNYKVRAIREGSGIPHMPGDFEQWYRIALPPLEEQERITSILSSTDQEIKTWQQELAHLQQEKKALMQQLLTGKRRVKLSKQENHHANLL